VAVADEDGFLSRWARRKARAREGKPLEEPVLAKPVPAVAAQSAGPKMAPRLQVGPEGQVAKVSEEAAFPEPAPLTLQDAQALTQHSDFKPFMAQQVQPEVRNAAMKKLFADPHYNIMDGLDTYIDDYTQSDPIPESMLRQMVGAQFLRLFDDDAATPATPVASVAPAAPDAGPPESPADLPSASVAQSTVSTVSTEPCLSPDHAHTPLRLQPDHAPAGPDIGSRPA
jgi:hypothetical protein